MPETVPPLRGLPAVSIAHRVRSFLLALAIPAAALSAPVAAGLSAGASGHGGGPSFGAPAVAQLTDTVEDSPNWGGYMATGTTFRSVQATFTVPELDCTVTPGSTRNPALVAEWAGLDSVTVEQDGISGQCADGHAEYAAWYEMFPKDPVYPGVRISAGNTIEVSVRYVTAKGEYQLILDNLSSGKGFTKWRRCSARSCANASAEVITEAPGKSVAAKTAYYPLADYGSTSFTAISITDAAGQSGAFTSAYWQVTRFAMQDHAGRVKAAIGSLTGDGDTFATYWEHEN